jgi:hypothetical protein
LSGKSDGHGYFCAQIHELQNLLKKQKMLRQALHSCIYVLLPIFLSAQKPYFQQTVDYRIQATLDDRVHKLTATIEIDYTNRSPDTLRSIWMHLWPNAFADRRSAYSRQELAGGDAKFYFADAEALGGLSALDFTVDKQKATWRFDREHGDIAVVELPQPLLPGGKITLATPFELDVPASFSRLGHVGTSYQMTQWFPKPAVYDRLGWHAMPYLDQGEFYSEFGSFDVSITLPENYVVGATGALQTPSEREFLQQKERETLAWFARSGAKPSGRDSFPVSAARTKTLRYTAENVHDFAWFADKRFHVLKDTARLAGGATVDCWAMFLPSDAKLWRQGAFYVRRAVEFYSENVGAYPWPHATAVHSALSAGGGMEYPMITVIGNENTAEGLDEVITHEVGHNWFYGLLASNERDHPWMDEGVNSYYERRYMDRYYRRNVVDGALPRWLADTLRHGSLVELGHALLARERLDMPPDSPSDSFTFLVYGLQTYMKPALALRWVEQAAGRARFDAAMQEYFRRWKFRHPYPADLRESWQAAGLRDTDWFFALMQTGHQADFALTDVERTADGYRLHVANRGDLADVPFPVTALVAGRPVATRWFQAPGAVDFPGTAEADEFVVDYYRSTLDVRRKNNARRTHGLFPALEPVNFAVLGPLEDARRSTLAVLPWLGWNNYDKLMLGAVVYNAPLPTRRLQYYLAPGYGFGSNRLTGLADVRLRFFPGGAVPKLTLGVSGKLFSFDHDARSGLDSRYRRIVPELRAELRDRSNTFFHAVNARALFIHTDRAFFSAGDSMPVAFGRDYTIGELRYEGEERRLPDPYRFAVALEHQGYYSLFDSVRQRYLRATVEWRQQLFYRRNKKFTARFFAGYFLANVQRDAGTAANDLARGSLALNPQGFNDYRFDEVFLGRTETTGFLARQVSQGDGGFKTAFGSPFGATIGTSNNYLAALNLRADLPIRLPLGLPLKPYADFGYYDPALGAPEFVWNGGLLLSFFGGIAELYFPLAGSATLNDRYKELAGNNYLKRISWSINLKEVLPERLFERLLR